MLSFDSDQLVNFKSEVTYTFNIEEPLHTFLDKVLRLTNQIFIDIKLDLQHDNHMIQVLLSIFNFSSRYFDLINISTHNQKDTRYDPQDSLEHLAPVQ